MPTPNLLHPVPVVVQGIRRAATHYDNDAREPVQTVQRTIEITVPGQVKWESLVSFSPEREGANELGSGYVLFRYRDLAALTLDIQRGDKIVSVGGKVCTMYVVRLEPCGHYPDAGGPTMLKAHFETRAQ